ncbi:MAG TPA: bifunctional precorrin-2 dehydrogenase/sirohydrochlorin ferrochelatase [Methylomirabilota bacterium]|nr:bifunctional precorrin-2 dehydrogenase/sirohydrochlorin ferrochelatase [Methylomirabilota bacterium]
MSRFGYPVTLDLEGRPCFVVGGGMIAERKATGLLAAGARVTVLSPSLSPALMRLATDGRLAWRPRSFSAGDTAGFVLVMVATDDGMANAAVAAEAREHRALVNCADDPDRCDFILPALLHRGPVTVAVSTGGVSPAMARLVRDELAALLPAEWSALAGLVADVRQGLRQRGLSLDGERWRRALDGELRRLVASGRSTEARRRLLEGLGV